MIVSRALGFVFVKARKVGGTSAEIALSTICHDPDDIVTPITPVDERARLALGGVPRNFAWNGGAEAAYRADPAGAKVATLRFRNHMTYPEIAAELDVTGLRVFGVVRSPEGMVVSWANHQIAFARYRRTGEAMRAPAADIRRAVDLGLEEDRWRGATLSDVYRGAALEPLRHERLDADLAALMAGLAPDMPVPRVRAKEGLGLSAAEATALLRPDQRARIRMAFAEDVERFGL